MTEINGRRQNDQPADARSTAEVLEEHMRLINRVLFELATEHPDADTLPESHRRIIQAHAESLFKTDWVSDLAGRFVVTEVTSDNVTELDAGQANLIAEARKFGYVGDNYERAREFIAQYVKRYPDAKPFLGAPVEAVEMGGK